MAGSMTEPLRFQCRLRPHRVALSRPLAGLAVALLSGCGGLAQPDRTPKALEPEPTAPPPSPKAALPAADEAEPLAGQPVEEPAASDARAEVQEADRAAAASPALAQGSKAKVEPAEPEPARVWSAEGLVKIYEKPDRSSRIIGAIRAGQSVALRSATPSVHLKLYQCTDGWYPVEPRGHICVGGLGHGTLDGDEPRVIAAAAVLPDTASPYPFRFGDSVGAPQYLRIPTAEEQRQSEPGLDAYLAQLPPPDEALGGAIDTTPAGVGPPEVWLRYEQQAKPPLLGDKPAFATMKVSWAREFDAAGRTWLVTPDLTLIPKDKVRTKPGPELQGIDLRANPDMALPLAFAWLEDAPIFEKGPDGEIAATGAVVPRHAFVPATGRGIAGKGGPYWVMRDGSLIRFPDVTIIKRARGRPPRVGPNDKWVQVRVTWGFLVAYEGDTPVYAAAMSPGADGINPRAHATRRGRHHIGWKMISADMHGTDKGAPWLVDEVPWVQYYDDSYALHGAWWHDEFGRPKSHGCVNLPPADARWLFHWMDPAMPEGWYAVTSYYPHVAGTLVELRH